jgi:hypothetical protein
VRYFSTTSFKENHFMGSALEELANSPDPQPPTSPQSGGYTSALEALANSPDPVEQGVTRNQNNSFVITPKEGESFSDTMKRAAAAGKTVTPDLIQSQARKGLREVPTVLAAAPAIGAAGTAALAAPGEIPAAVKAVRAMVTAHPVAAQVIKKAFLGLAGAEAYKHSKWLMDLLP